MAIAPAPFKGEHLSFRAVEGVFRRFITKLVVRKIPIGLVTTIDDGNMRLHTPR